jgi:phenylacetate-CoA ligase
LDLLGFEDAQGDFLLTHETQYIEILNDEGQAVKPGEEGRVIVTALYNHAMPFIRYELGDRVLLKSSKKGPYQVIERIVGRTNDIAILPSGKKSPGLTFYYISKSLLEGGGFMKEFIIRQKTLRHFHFEYVAEREISDLEKIKIKEAMDQYLEPGLEATYEKKTHIERTKAGKLKQFFSEL